MNKKRESYLFALILIASLAAAVFVYQPLWGQISSARPWSLGLDLVGGSYLVYDIDLSNVPAADADSVVGGLRDVIEKRVNLFGVSEPRVYTQSVGSSRRLVVELAGIKNTDLAIKEIGATPLLDFRKVVLEPAASEVSVSTSSAPLDLSNASSTGLAYKFIPTALTGRYVKGAQVLFDNITGQPYIGLEFNDEGAKMFEKLTEELIGQPLAIFLDNQLIEMPTVQEKIIGGRASITGQFTFDQAKKIVERFNAGALPAPIKLVNQYTISPILGKNSLDNSIKAGIIGLAAVILFMVIYYRRLGLFAAAALLMYSALLLGLFKLIPITLTLSGIAGVILSIGIAVDANVLVFERTKEEIKRGVENKSAIEEGFRRAWSSIRDSNITTIISAVILYMFTTGFVQGFALALLIGVILSMFSAITLTRAMLRLFYNPKQKHD